MLEYFEGEEVDELKEQIRAEGYEYAWEEDERSTQRDESQ